MSRELPLFPLKVVLYPGMALPLHVFEERYKEMMRKVLAGDKTFGVVLIKEGPEVGGPAVPHAVGTTARVEAVEQLPGGRLNLITLGVERYRILDVVRHEPFLVGRVELLEEEVGSVSAELAAAISERLTAYLSALRELRLSEIETVVQDPVALSYQVARMLRAASPLARQGLLELPTAADRLEHELGMLKAELDLMRLLATAPRSSDASQGPFSKN
jgi:Lon protease-like protein